MQDSRTADPSARLERYLEFDSVHAPYLRWQLEQFEPYVGGRVLEIGCGLGGIVAQLEPRELIIGLEPEGDLIEYAQRRHSRRPDCRFVRADILRLSTGELAELRDARPDTILCINVLEHISDDAAALALMEQIVRPTGMVCLLVPAHPRLYGAYDQLDGHFRRYTRRSLKAVIARTSLRPVRMRYFNALGAAGWWFRYHILRSSTHTERDFRMMNRLIPFLRQIERLIPPPFGLSLVTVLQKP